MTVSSLEELSTLSPIFLFFVLSSIGICIGKLRIRGIALGTAAVLLVSLIFGLLAGIFESVTIGKLTLLLHSNESQRFYSLFSTFGSALFISAIGLDAGKSFHNGNKTRKLYAFLSGILTVAIGAVITFLLFRWSGKLSKELMLGLFAGGMTSTPTLSAICERYGADTTAVIGYGMAYPFGLLAIVLFVQMRCNKVEHQKSLHAKNQELFHEQTKSNVPLLLCTALAGTVLGEVIPPIGSTGGILLFGLLFGFLYSRKGRTLPDMGNLRSLGLAIFFVGTGVSSGIGLAQSISVAGCFVGILISVSSVLIGYLITHCFFGFSGSNALAIVSGGMTSTPAIGALQSRDPNCDLSLYTMSYIGALSALLISVHLLSWIFV